MSKLKKLKEDLIDLLRDKNLSEETIELVFMEFESTHSVFAREDAPSMVLSNEELKRYSDEKESNDHGSH